METMASHIQGMVGTLPVIREHIVATPDTCGGKPRIAGSRIQVKHVAIMHERQGMSLEEIISEFPHLTMADIHAALAYYHDHREEINAEITADREWYEEQPKLALKTLATPANNHWLGSMRDDARETRS